MKIIMHEIPIRELVIGYLNSDEEGVYGYDSKLNIRPKYQREFVYNNDQRNAVINTVRHGFPLNVMYWAINLDGTLEVLDGQQRIMSICEYISGSYAIDYRYYHNLEEDEKNQILDYKLTVYFCEGSDSEKLEWFKTINIAGAKLTDQELRNAVYTGPWLSDAKRYFSRTGCAAHGLASDYMNGSPIRQDYLEKVLSWISDGHIEEYMARHQSDGDANELWTYFQNVIHWVKVTFPEYRREMKGIDWGFLYNEYKSDSLNSNILEEKTKMLMMDDDVTKKSGIYAYLLSGNENSLSLRAFTKSMKREAYERQEGLCAVCGNHFEIDEMEGDHIKPWCEGGKTSADNLQMLCRDCNRKKGKR